MSGSIVQQHIFNAGRQGVFGRVPAAQSEQNLPKAQWWLNIGYTQQVEVTNPETNQRELKSIFISLERGVGLDTMKELPTNSRSENYAAQNQARNLLHAQIMEVAQTMAPGDEVIISSDPNTGLQLHLRRVHEALPALANEAGNPLVRKLNLAPVTA